MDVKSVPSDLQTPLEMSQQISVKRAQEHGHDYSNSEKGSI